jgi:Endonuclease NucS C-terminal domain
MASKIKVWEISDGKLNSPEDVSFADSHSEAELEEWLCNGPDLLGEKLLVIARQLPIPNVGRLDLLCMDANGKLVIVELKRDLTTREAVAQALDYASWLDAASEADVLAYATDYLQRKSEDTDATLVDAFEECFGKTLPDWVCQNHRVVVAAAQVDSSAERIINYLAQRHGFEINAVFFNFVKLSTGNEILIRSVLVPEALATGRAAGGRSFSETMLMSMAAEHNTTDLVRICRQISRTWDEEWAGTAGGSFRYWTRRRDGLGEKMVFGINVSGSLTNTGPGELAVWVRTDSLSEVTGLPEEVIKNPLAQISPPISSGRMTFVIRLKSATQADQLLAELEAIASGRATNSTT